MILGETNLKWGTYGYEGDQPLVYKPLHELDQEDIEEHNDISLD